MRIDWEYKQVVKNIRIETKEDADNVLKIIKDLFYKDEVKLINGIIDKL